MCNDLDLPISDLLDVDLVAQIAGATLDLDAIMQEFLEGRQVEDLVANRLRAVDGVLQRKK